MKQKWLGNVFEENFRLLKGSTVCLAGESPMLGSVCSFEQGLCSWIDKSKLYEYKSISRLVPIVVETLKDLRIFMR